MTKREARIDSYFSIATDLAGELRSLPEFVSGEGYFTQLASSLEQVTVELVPQQEDDRQFVRVCGEGDGPLFHSVLGRVIYAMAAHSDDLSVMRWGTNEA
jgi:hypothetical protein